MSDDPLIPGADPYPLDLDDEIVAEVRAIREEISAECGHDMDRLYERFKKREDAERAAGRIILSPLPRPNQAD